MSSSEQSTYGLVVAFPDESESFTLGFEAGAIWRRMEQERDFTALVHTKNELVLLRMASSAGLQATFNPTSVPEWSDVVFSPAPPSVRLVRSNP